MAESGEQQLSSDLVRLERERLEEAALGGRVAHTAFLEPDPSAQLVQALRRRGVSSLAWGGFPGARRRVVTAFPAHVPNATTSLIGVYFEVAVEPRELHAALISAGVDKGGIGDAVRHSQGVSVVSLDPPAGELNELASLAGTPVSPRLVPLEKVASGSVRRVDAVVPSLRVDAVGAKAFRVSRSYFGKGVAGGKVSVNGRSAGKSSSAEPGDEIYADGLGRLRVLSVDGETRRGNIKVSLEVETS